jgi:hypothetical protein
VVLTLDFYSRKEGPVFSEGRPWRKSSALAGARPSSNKLFPKTEICAMDLSSALRGIASQRIVQRGDENGDKGPEPRGAQRLGAVSRRKFFI